jgi:Uma2 family endonuclease
MSTQTTRHTFETFEQIAASPENRDRLLELIYGGIVEKVLTPDHGFITAWLITFINIFLIEHPIGVLTTEARHKIDDKNARLPDIAFKAGQTMPLPENHFAGTPDLAVEVKSPTDTYKSMREKAAFYMQNGAQMVWLVFPEKRLIEVYSHDADILILDINDTLEGGDVLPGFSLSVRKLFEQ